MQDKTYRVYYLKNKQNGKLYFGCTTDTLEGRVNETYRHNEVLHNDILSLGLDNFEKEVIKEFKDKESALILESSLMKKYNTTNPNKGYNILSKKEFNNTSKEFKEKARKRTSGVYNPMFGKEWTENQKKNSSFKGHHHTEEAKKRISEANKNKIVSIETKEKLSKALKGRTFSEETRKKMSESAKRKKMSNSHKENISKRQSNSIWINKDGVSKSIQKEELDNYIQIGWLKGRGKLKKHSTDNSKYSEAASNRVWLSKDGKRTHCSRLDNDKIIKLLNEGWHLGIKS